VRALLCSAIAVIANTSRAVIPTLHCSRLVIAQFDHSFDTANSLFDKKARLNLINRAGPSPREGGSRWCQAQGNHVAPAQSVRKTFTKKGFHPYR